MRVEFAKIFFISAFAFNLVACGDDSLPEPDKKNKKVHEELSIKVIYGEDNRQDLYAVKEKGLVDLADSTVALISTGDLSADNQGWTHIHTTPFAESYRLPLCSAERFREQDTAAFCSGFLVAPNLVATAGHCIQTQGTVNSDCTTTRFVFGFNIKSPGERPLTVPSHDVYSCKRIVAHKLEGTGADYTLVELDRPVMDRAPLRIRRSGEPMVNDHMTVIGHPSGLPTKVSSGAQVRSVLATHFVANLDTYGGNSGSAVFNTDTGEVEGILVRGETDFVVQGSCMTSKVCESTGCRGEDVTRISNVAGWIPEQP